MNIILSVILIALLSYGATTIKTDIDNFLNGDVTIAYESYELYEVQCGDTYWSIAASRYPGAHTGEKAYELKIINGNKELHPGMMIKIHD